MLGSEAELQTKRWSAGSLTETSLHDALINRLLLICSYAGAVALLLSLLRVFETGWLNLYSTHLAILGIVLLVTVFRYQLQTHLKVAVLILLSLSVAMAGQLALGLAAGGVFFLALAAVMLTLFCNRELFVLFGIIAIAYLALVGLGFVEGSLQPQAEFQLLMTSPSHWLAYGVGLTFFLIVSAITMLNYRDTLLDLVSQVERQRDEIQHLANHDHLTGLPTLRLAEDRLEMALKRAHRTGQRAAVLFVDLDNFKMINDRYGHDAGDRCLCEVSDRMSKVVRTEDTVARIGGDEFLVIVDRLPSLERAHGVAESLLNALQQPVNCAGENLLVSASIGVAVYPDHAVSAEKLRYEADKAMYRAKGEGRGRVVLAN